MKQPTCVSTKARYSSRTNLGSSSSNALFAIEIPLNLQFKLQNQQDAQLYNNFISSTMLTSKLSYLGTIKQVSSDCGEVRHEVKDWQFGANLEQRHFGWEWT